MATPVRTAAGNISSEPDVWAIDYDLHWDVLSQKLESLDGVVSIDPYDTEMMKNVIQVPGTQNYKYRVSITATPDTLDPFLEEQDQIVWSGSDMYVDSEDNTTSEPDGSTTALPRTSLVHEERVKECSKKQRKPPKEKAEKKEKSERYEDILRA